MTKVSLHRFADLPRRFLWALGLGLGILTVGAIAPPPAPTENARPTVTSHQFAALPISLDATLSFWTVAQDHLPGVMPVIFYTPTATCEDYVGEAKAIAEDKAILQIVHFLMAEQTPHLLDFELAGYRVFADPKSDRVTIDLRRSPSAKRHFVSLSICEQRVLFGSLRQTLLKNPELGINSVQFTEQGRPIEI